MTAARAAVDVGSNSVRLLVVDAHGERVTRELAITRLAEGVDRTGHLDDAALHRTVQTIQRFRAIWASHGVDDRVRIAATSAVRDADDRDRFLDAVEQEVGVRPEVLAGDDEAALAFAGATSAVEVGAPAAVVDIGGGSTELIVGTVDGRVAGSVSLQLGCVRLTERCLHDDVPSDDQRRAAADEIARQLDRADATLAAQGTSVREAVALVGVAGTATTLGALHLGLSEYLEERIHGVRLPAAVLDSLVDELMAMPAADRAALGPMQPGREDVIHGGALILGAVARRYDVEEVVVSEADGLDGLVASLT